MWRSQKTVVLPVKLRKNTALKISTSAFSAFKEILVLKSYQVYLAANRRIPRGHVLNVAKFMKVFN